ncbi:MULTISPECIES: arylsulfotransferase family protein [Catenuloplanes]|uniref:Arylsulfotransferase ASST n=1 Tax=Catenuloplanes niger TaxID=587534 RepID=A0AAE3ZQ03_9ACTN|nr:arylsulfotransferase family protein [Catenuloplanes niger]MDR7323431.1 hypothetical protein [Catenuloplanes niger]
MVPPSPISAMPDTLPEPPRRWSRRQLLIAGAGLAAVGLTGCGAGFVIGADSAREANRGAEAGGADNLLNFISRPDLHVQRVVVSTPAPDPDSGLVFLTPAQGRGQFGTLIVDTNGVPVWFRPVPAPATVAIDLKVQKYQDKPVLTWWEGLIGGTGGLGIGQGEFVIYDNRYREVTRIRADGVTQADQHDLKITSRGTALFWVYRPISADLTSVGGPAAGALHDGVLQEVDIATGKLLMEWRASDHVPFDESYAPLPAGDSALLPYDYFHANSVAEDSDGNLLVSARHTWTVYKIDRSTGDVIWRLGGKRSDFRLPPEATFSWQHDARRRSDGTIGLFDNAAGITREHDRSRGLILALDEDAGAATLVREYVHPRRLSAPTQGSMEERPDGRSFIGWGELPYFTEFAEDGTVLFDGRLPSDSQSYRATRATWTAEPADQPAVGLRREAGKLVAYASWNGATEVETWQIRAGSQPGSLGVVAEGDRTGFETALTVPTDPEYLRADAFAANGRLLGSSAIIPVRG